MSTAAAKGAMPGRAKAGPYLAGLDIARFMAALLVMAFHYGFWLWAAPESTAAETYGRFAEFPGLQPFTWFGWVGVEIFFVLSGFLIASSANGSSPFAFVRSRVVRLVPAAWLCATFTVVVAVGGGFASWGEMALPYLRSMAFVPKAPWVDGVYWTLGIEITFYALVFGLLCLNRFRWLVGVVGGLGVASTVVWLVWACAPQVGVVQVLVQSRLAQMLLVQHGCLFAVGTLLWLALSHRAGWLGYGMLAISVVGSLLEIRHETLSKGAGVAMHFSPVVPMLVWLAAVAFMVVTVRYNAVVLRFLGHFPARQLGLLTYPFYLLHNNVGVVFMGVLVLLGVPALGALASAVVFMLVVCWWVSQVAEKKLQNVFRQGFRWCELLLEAGRVGTAGHMFKPTRAFGK